MWEIEAIVRSLIWHVVSKDYDGLIKRCPASRMTADEFRSEIEQYGRTFIMPPPSGYEKYLTKVQVQDPEHPTWHVDAPLWTQEEGRSDLELQVLIAFVDDVPQIEICSVRVP